MPVKLERFVRVMTFGHGVTANLVNVRNGKVISALTAVYDALEAAKAEGVGVAALQATYDDLENKRAAAMLLGTNKAKCDALDPLKPLARAAANTAVSTVENGVRIAKEIQIEMRMVDGMCKKFANIVKNGLPRQDKARPEQDGDDSEPEPLPDISYLAKPAKDTPGLIKRARKLIKTDVIKAETDWHGGWGPYQSALQRYTKEVIKPPLLKKANDLILSNPDGPEAKMKKALGPRFEVSLVQVAQTAEAFGVNNDKLSPGEQVAVFTYTKQDYEPMNQMLLGILTPAPTGKLKEDLESKCTEAAAALTKLDPYVGLSTRGERDWPGADAQYTAGNEFTIKQFWSSGVGFKFSGKYQITIDGKTGKDVAGFSNSPNESEILFAPGTKFKVITRDDTRGPDIIAVLVREV